MAANPDPAEPKRTWLDHLPPSVKAALEALTPYERRFVQLYCGPCRGNQTLAAQELRRTAKSRKKGNHGKQIKRHVAPVSYQTAASIGSQMLMRPHVRAAVNAWMDAMALSAAEVTFKIADLADASMAPFVQLVPEFGRKRKGSKSPAPIKGWSPTLKLASDMDWHQHQHWIKKVRTHGKTGKIIELELHDRFAAAKELAKILKLTSDQPILALNLHFQQLSDDQVLHELKRAYAEIAEARHGEGDPRALPPGPVVVVEPDDDADAAPVGALLKPKDPKSGSDAK